MNPTLPSLPNVSLPKGGGAIQGMGEKFSVNALTGTGTTTIPIKTSNARAGMQPQLSLRYDSGKGNGSFGLGWSLAGVGAITRKTAKGLPRYRDRAGSDDDVDSDVFLMSDAEDLVPRFKVDSNGITLRDKGEIPIIDESVQDGFLVRRYSPRIEQGFMRIERWTNISSPEEVHWRVTTPQNQTTVYGSGSNSRICDPAASPDGPLRIFSWLAAESYDARGNAMTFTYKEESSVKVPLTQANETNRQRTANRYIQHIRYGNTTPNRDLNSWSVSSAFTLPDDTWKFSVVFDYGEYNVDFPQISDGAEGVGGAWSCRPDPFSDHHAGFEVRTYRLCQRILMFHHFPNELGVSDYLVASTDCLYNLNPTGSYLLSAQHAGYTLDAGKTSYTKKVLPPTSFTYSLFPTDEELVGLTVQDVDRDSLENLPIGIDNAAYKWVDLDGQGLSGVLSEQGDDWYFKGNTSANNFIAQQTDNNNNNVTETVRPRLAAMERLLSRPSLSVAGPGGATFGDVTGAGILDVIQHDAVCWGFHERLPELKGWTSFRVFNQFPNIDTSQKGVNFVDLTGDGLADVLVSADQVFSWFPSLCADGYGDAPTVSQFLDESKGPVWMASDTENSVFIADMSGDGLMDIVRIRNGDVCYWPNLGYGKFGSVVQMDNAPWFDRLDLFDEKRIHLADIDGSGTTDIIYVSGDGIDIFLNQSGNSFADSKRVGTFSPIEDTAVVSTLDLLGNGTSCIVWSSSLPSLSGQASLQYLDLMQGRKPHLLVQVNNNIGAETRIHYSPSTKFYLDDADAGNAWLTRLPFPVHCVDRLEITDRIARNHFVSTYAYHHGYFDGVEREFRGFARVDRRDTEDFAAMSDSASGEVSQNVDASWHVPPSLTKTWFHTGVFLDEDSISRHMAAEYFGAPASPTNDVGAMDTFLQTLLPDTVIPGTPLATDALREAYRALKGSTLRQEIYADDGSTLAGIPYSVEESSFTIEVVQGVQDAHAHSIYSVHPRESISYHYERNVDDPRVDHNMVLQVDAFGNTLKELHLAYGRTPGQSSLTGDDRIRQETSLFTYAENDVTNGIDTATDYRTPIPYQRRRYELSGFTISASKTRLGYEDFTDNNFAALTQLSEIPFEQVNDPAKRQRRLFSQTRSVYRSDSLDGVLPPGQVEPLAIPEADYQLCFTPGLLAKVYTRQFPGQTAGPAENLLPDPNGVLGGASGGGGGGYINIDSNGSWWKSPGQIRFIPDTSLSPAQELAEAQSHFFSPRAFIDQFGNVSTVDYDAYSLQLLRVVDPVGNATIADVDYRLLTPWAVTDANGNRAAAMFDALGSVVGTAAMGKPGENVGDSFDGFQADLTQAQIDAFFTKPRSDMAMQILGKATSRFVYDPTRYWRDTTGSTLPGYSATISRETHASDPVPADGLKIQVSFQYSDGFGRVVQAKMQVKAGPVVDGGPVVPQRWVGSGWTIFNNKGSPVRKYEPFFDDTHDFKYDMRIGVSPVIIYDALSRPVATLYPDHTYQKLVFSPWHSTEYDSGDNVRISNPKTDDVDVGHFFDQLPQHEYLPSWYDARIRGQLGSDEVANAQKADTYANTPTTAHFDPMGRVILSVQDNGGGTTFSTSVTLDITGRTVAVVDALARMVVTSDYSLCGEGIHHASMEAGKRWMLSDGASKPLLDWNSRGYRFRNVYDAARRPTELWAQQQGSSVNEFLLQKTIWGEEATDSQQHNLRGKTFTLQDQAGTVVSSEYDFKGNLLTSSRQYAREYRNDIDWSAAVELEDASYAMTASYDALNRVVLSTAADASVQFHGYDEGGHLNTVSVNILGESGSADPLQWTTVMKGVDHNAKNQITGIQYGNGVSRTYVYDALRFRLTSITTTRPSGDQLLQALIYIYDPEGNVTHLRDDAQQTIFFRNKRVDPTCDYNFDPLYRLVSASGREHLGQVSGGGGQPGSPSPPQPLGNTSVDQPSDGNAMGTYAESYTYDEVGNILSIAHAGSDPKTPGWTRRYTYAEASLLEPGKKSNRLSSTSVGSATDAYTYDAHGNMASMSHLTRTDWDCRDQLRATSQQRVNGGVPETTYYRYDGSGTRIRKVTDRQVTAAGPAAPTRMKERLYLSGGLELYREYAADGTSITLARDDLDIDASSIKRIVLIQSRTQGTDGGPARLQRYQIENHLSSATIELDEQAAIVSYEEYFPYGGSSYAAVASQTEVPAKRYRFCGRERDDESGLDYGGARYYAAWLGRWTSCDPAGFVDEPNLYAYARLNPVRFDDPGGTESTDTKEPQKQTPAPAAAAADPAVQTSFNIDDGKAVERSTTLSPPNNAGATLTNAPLANPAPRDKVTPDATFLDTGFTSNIGGTYSGSLGQHQLSLGVTNAQAEFHTQLLSEPEFDIGGMLGGSLVDQQGWTKGGYLTAMAHYGHRIGDDGLAYGLYAQGGFGVQKSTDGTKSEAASFSVTPAFGSQKDGAKYSYTLNPIFSFAQTGSLSRGPVMSNLLTAGFLGGLGISMANDWGATVEGGASYNFSATPSAQSATALSPVLALSFTHASLTNTGPTKASDPGSLMPTKDTRSGPSGGKTTVSITFGISAGFDQGKVRGPGTSDSQSGPFTTVKFGAWISIGMRQTH
jgi:RHS repeat-associated protein